MQFTAQHPGTELDQPPAVESWRWWLGDGLGDDAASVRTGGDASLDDLWDRLGDFA